MGRPQGSMLSCYIHKLRICFSNHRPLGSNPVMRYTITHGQKLGRTIGFPTINLKPAILPEISKHGSYLCAVGFPKTEEVYDGVLYFGPKGEDQSIVLEVHLFDFSREAYGEEVEISVREYLRAPQKYETISALKEAIAGDIALAKRFLATD